MEINEIDDLLSEWDYGQYVFTGENKDIEKINLKIPRFYTLLKDWKVGESLSLKKFPFPVVTISPGISFIK